MAVTPARQRNVVSEGVALGLLLRGRSTLPFDKVRVDLAFTGAWRGWDSRGRFPQVNTDLSIGMDGTRAVCGHSRGRHWAISNDR